MDKRWKRVHLLSVNLPFREDIEAVRSALGIPVDGFPDISAGEQYAKLLGYHRNGVAIPIDPKTNQPLVDLQSIQVTYDLLGASPLLLEWGIGKFAEAGGSEKFPSEDFSELSDNPLDQHVAGLKFRYQLPGSEFVSTSIRDFILTADDSYLEFDSLDLIGSISDITVQPIANRKEFNVLIKGVPPDISQKNWRNIFLKTKELMREQKEQRDSSKFELHRFMYKKVKFDGVSKVAAEIEWTDKIGQPHKVSDTMLSQTIRELENLMKPLEYSE